MDAFKERTNFRTSENVSKEQPSMFDRQMNNCSPNESPSSLDIPGEFEFLNKDSVSETQKQAVKFGVRVFRDWLNKQGVQFQSLEDMSRGEIAQSLEQFYLTARRPNGTQYKKNTLKSIKHSLDHYLRCSPLKKDFSISTDYDFRQANQTLYNLPDIFPYDTGMKISDEASSFPWLNVVKPITSAVQSLHQTYPNTNQNHGTEALAQSTTATVDCSTHTKPANKEWLESAYYKADLKTRNKMRLQARKSLLSFLEELNEISHGHGTELFYEIVQEETDMWKSITEMKLKFLV